MTHTQSETRRVFHSFLFHLTNSLVFYAPNPVHLHTVLPFTLVAVIFGCQGMKNFTTFFLSKHFFFLHSKFVTLRQNTNKQGKTLQLQDSLTVVKLPIIPWAGEGHDSVKAASKSRCSALETIPAHRTSGLQKCIILQQKIQTESKPLNRFFTPFILYKCHTVCCKELSGWRRREVNWCYSCCLFPLICIVWKKSNLVQIANTSALGSKC